MIPLIPHMELFGPFIHTDDLPILLFSIIFLLTLINEKKFTVDLTGKYLLTFIFYLVFQNFYINNSFVSSDLYRFFFYFLLYLYFLNVEDTKVANNLPLYLFLALSIFSIFSYFFEINLGKDSYQTWSIGFNPSDIEYLKGRVNGFQAGGPNSYADLISITAIYNLYRYEKSYALFIVPLSLLAVIFTYSRFALIILVLFILAKLLKDRMYWLLLVVLVIFLVAFLSLGVADRFLNDDNNGISDRLSMLNAAFDYYSSSSLKAKLIGVGSNQVIFLSDNVLSFDDFKDNPFSFGPHNSFVFYLINYGIIGLVLFFLIFFRLFTNIKLKASVVAVFSIFLLSLSTDLLHNHSISWILYYFYFSSLTSEN